MTRVRWWTVFLLDVLACLATAALAGAAFGIHALIEDVQFAWRR